MPCKTKPTATKAEREAAIETSARTCAHVSGPFVVTRFSRAAEKSIVVAGPYSTVADAQRACDRHDRQHLAFVDLARAFPQWCARKGVAA